MQLKYLEHDNHIFFDIGLLLITVQLWFNGYYLSLSFNYYYFKQNKSIILYSRVFVCECEQMSEKIGDEDRDC